MQSIKFMGFNGSAYVYGDRVELKKRLGQRVGGAIDAVVRFEEMLTPISKHPTLLLNGWVYLPTNSDPEHLAYWSDPPKTKIGKNPQIILFTWGQRKTQEEFIAAVNEGLENFES